MFIKGETKMGEQKYLRGLEVISETAQKYKKKRELFQDKQKEKQDCINQIDSIKQEIENLSSKGLSIDDIKKDELMHVEKTFKDEVEEANKKYKSAIDEIEYSEKCDSKVRESIESEFAEKISYAHIRVDEAKAEVDGNMQASESASRVVAELEQQISNSELEENQIKLCATHIAPEYDNVVNNTEFISDYRDPRGASPEDAQKKFQLLSAKRIKKIASKMNTGAYVSSPDESKGLPILEILIMAATTLWLVIKGIGKGVVLLYKPVRRFRKTTHKMVYAAVVTLILFLLVLFVSSRFGDGIVAILLLAIVTFLGMILFNVIKYSNKAFRKEQNLEYYTVGYFFTFAKDEILYKIACDYYTDLKTKNPTELDSIHKATFGTLKTQKEMADQELFNCQKQLDASKLNMVSVEEQFAEEKNSLEGQCKERVGSTIKKLCEEREIKRQNAKDELERCLALSKKKKEDAINNAENKAMETLKKRKCDIEEANQRLLAKKGQLQTINDELDVICTEVNVVLNENNDMASEYKKLDIDSVDKREKGDKLPEVLVAGLTKTKKTNLGDGSEETVYDLKHIKHGRKPMIVVCNADDDESINVTERFYSFIDSLLADTLANMYIGGFRYVLVDSQGNKPGIMKNMGLCSSSFEGLEKFGCVKVCTDSSNKCFDEIIHEQEKALNGKDIDVFNEERKNLDNMVRYTFLCVRVYSKKTGDFSLADFRKRIDSSLNNGIIPIVLMSQNYFEEKKNDLENTIKELCGNKYYMLDVNQDDAIQEKNLY